MEGTEIVVVSNLQECKGRVVLNVSPNQTVSDLIQAFCANLEIPRRSDFALYSRRGQLRNGSKLLKCGLQPREQLYLVISEEESWACNCNQWWLLAAICLLIGACGITAISIVNSKKEGTYLYTYGVGLDAGSSHTQLYVYRWLARKDNDTGIVTEMMTCPSVNETKMAPISSYANNPQAAGLSLMTCLNRTKQVIAANDFPKTPVFFGATAGMRLLRLQNETIADEIMASVRSTIYEYHFNVTKSQLQHTVRIINGTEEGAFAWISTNYLSGLFGFIPMSRIQATAALVHSRPRIARTNETKLFGALDLGGASTQIAFSPLLHNSCNESDDYRRLKLYGTDYCIYTHSRLCFGLNEALLKYRALLVKRANFTVNVDDPCAPRGNSTVYSGRNIFIIPCSWSGDINDTYLENNYTFRGLSDYSQCLSLTRELFNVSSNCSHPPCAFDGIHQPEIYGKFLAFSGFYYTMSFFNLTGSNRTVSLGEFVLSVQTYCNKTWKEIEDIPAPSGDASVLVISCFRANYIFTLLVDVYHFNYSTWKSITFSDKISGAYLGWILGMMVNTTNEVPAVASTSTVPISLPVFIILIILFAVFIFLSIGFTCHAVHEQRRAKTLSGSHGSSNSYGSVEDREPFNV